MDQLDLFEKTAPYHPGSATSKASAKAIEKDLSRLQAVVYKSIYQAGKSGLTRDEISHVTGLKGDTLRPRVNELKKNGFVYEDQTTGTRPMDSGHAGGVLVAWKFYEQLLHRKQFMDAIAKLLAGSLSFIKGGGRITSRPMNFGSINPRPGKTLIDSEGVIWRWERTGTAHEFGWIVYLSDNVDLQSATLNRLKLAQSLYSRLPPDTIIRLQYEEAPAREPQAS